MSKLGEALQRKRRGERARVMGFGARAPGKDHALLLGMVDVSAEEAKAALAAGADFVAVSADDAAEAVAALAGLKGIPGARIASLEGEGVDALAEANADFVIVNPETAAAGVVDSEIGLALEVDEAWEDPPLRALAPLALDAVFVRAPVERFTVARRISLARVAGLCGAPLIVSVGADVSSADLGALRETGAGGVTVSKGTDLAGLIERLEAVPPRPKRRGEGGFAIVPSRGSMGDGEEFEDDD